MLRVISRCLSQQVHYPVMWRTVLQILDPLKTHSDSVLIGDGTVGAGGHSARILESLPNSYLIGVDIDKEVLPVADTNLRIFDGRYLLSHCSYVSLSSLPRFPGLLPTGTRFSAVLVDLGLSSYQLDSAERGFSYSKSGPLDMRFNRDDRLAATAGQIVNFASELELREIFRNLGEEPLHREAADVIVRYRAKQQIKTTKELSDVLNYALFISKSINRYQSIGRCFQALRIKVNNELTNIEAFLDDIFPHIEVNGRVVLISFHTLEDSRVKTKLERWMGEGIAEVPERMFIGAGPEELAENSRSGSARLRFCVKTADRVRFKRRT